MRVSWTWDDLGRYAAGLAACAVLGWFAFVQGSRVPVLAMFDLGIHELGHLLAFPLPQLLTVLAGSALQIAVPLGLSAYFLLVRRDRVAAAFTLAWAGTSAQDVSVYAADAPSQALPLIYPNAIHDWAWLLGPQAFDAMAAAGTISSAIAAAGIVAVLSAMGVLVHAAYRAQADRRSAEWRWFDEPVTVRRRPHPVPTRGDA